MLKIVTVAARRFDLLCAFPPSLLGVVQSQFGQVRHRVGSKVTTTVSRYDKAPTNCRGFFIIRPPALMEIIKGLADVSCTGTCQ
jgi:hypothetical protein